MANLTHSSYASSIGWRLIDAGTVAEYGNTICKSVYSTKEIIDSHVLVYPFLHFIRFRGLPKRSR